MWRVNRYQLSLALLKWLFMYAYVVLNLPLAHFSTLPDSETANSFAVKAVEIEPDQKELISQKV